MKIKIMAIALMSVLLVGCGKSEEEKKSEAVMAQFVAMQIEKNQMEAADHALTALSLLKAPAAEYYSMNSVCSDDILKTVNTSNNYLNMIDDISISDFPDGCQLKATFKESMFLPDMSKESMILTMSVDNGYFLWKCEFTGKNKRDIPKVCR